jgi:hypothetical protein
MMAKLSSGEITDIVYSDLVEIKQAEGWSLGIFKDAFPAGQTGEFIVIGTIGNTLIGEQVATVNVNVYVPDNRMTINGISQRVRNRSRIETLTTTLLGVIDNYTSGERYRYYKEACNVFSEEEIDYSFVNIRLTFKNN